MRHAINISDLQNITKKDIWSSGNGACLWDY